MVQYQFARLQSKRSLGVLRCYKHDRRLASNWLSSVDRCCAVHSSTGETRTLLQLLYKLTMVCCSWDTIWMHIRSSCQRRGELEIRLAMQTSSSTVMLECKRSNFGKYSMAERCPSLLTSRKQHDSTTSTAFSNSNQAYVCWFSSKILLVFNFQYNCFESSRKILRLDRTDLWMRSRFIGLRHRSL